jgi:hypothetical protein
VKSNLLPFVQFDYAGRLGPGDGRYLIREAGGERVLVVGGFSGPVSGFVKGRRRRGRPKRAQQRPEPPEVPITRLTVIRSKPFAGREDADAWLREATGSTERADELIGEALALVNRALHAHRVATQDPYGGGASALGALTIRLGFGSGDEVADGRWAEAVEVPPPSGPRRRSDALRPQERLAAELGGREPANACETLLLRARADLDGGRVREAALQLRVGLEALLAEVSAEGLTGEHAEKQAADLALLDERRSMTGDAANEALKGELSGKLARELSETLEICERVLRRRRILRQ